MGLPSGRFERDWDCIRDLHLRIVLYPPAGTKKSEWLRSHTRTLVALCGQQRVSYRRASPSMANYRTARDFKELLDGI